ncbi:glycosyltransferase [Salimicrobium humidisoli]|uniref:Amylovoran biosynthesis protein AmsE n=1 Tax=Salimicrobium humidisoli TaxID=2029857 RepID=A0ABX4HUG7_9BACI|nr:glycosyltransferase [Salimicrobium humidisoli]PBB06482.1 amylovoran biosynthesis protein AmsE [Salimicrobium humidisoli]
MKFSVLISVYDKETPRFFKEALESVVEQTLKPDEIVVVKDGRLTDGLEEVLQTFERENEPLVKIVPLEKNGGLGEALRIGVWHCSHPVIARMDSDDISLPHRFKTQIDYLKTHEDVDLVGGWISEFDENDSRRHTRTVPTGYETIRRRARYRNPLNHVSVMFRKQAVLKSGNYQTCLWNEDYYLWIRMLSRGCRIENIPEVLLDVRTGKGMYRRRGGRDYIMNEVKFQRMILESGFISRSEFVFNVSSRTFVRVLPNDVRSLIYTRMLRKKPVVPQAAGE